MASEAGGSQLYLQAWFQGITAAVALLALVLSAYGLYLQRVDKRPRLRVLAKSVDFYSGSEHIGDAYAVEVANTGQVPVIVAGIYVRPGHGRRDKFGFTDGLEGPPLPHSLRPGEASTWWVEYGTVRGLLRRLGYKGRARITLIAADGLNRYHVQRTRFYVAPPWWRRWFGASEAGSG